MYLSPLHYYRAISSYFIYFLGGQILVEGLPVPEVGIQDTLLEEMDVVQIPADHVYIKQVTAKEKIFEEKHSEENSDIIINNPKRVRPPLKNTNRRQTSVQASVSAANKLVEAQLKLNEIKENYYEKKLLLLERIANSIQLLVEKII